MSLSQENKQYLGLSGAPLGGAGLVVYGVISGVNLVINAIQGMADIMM